MDILSVKNPSISSKLSPQRTCDKVKAGVNCDPGGIAILHRPAKGIAVDKQANLGIPPQWHSAGVPVFQGCHYRALHDISLHKGMSDAFQPLPHLIFAYTNPTPIKGYILIGKTREEAAYPSWR